MSDQKPRGRGTGKPFTPGTSGNPKGRPKSGESLAEVVRQKWPPDKLVDEMSKHADSTNEAVAIRAKEWLAERGYGPAPKQVDVTVSGGDAPIRWGEMPLEKRRELAAALATADEIATDESE